MFTLLIICSLSVFAQRVPTSPLRVGEKIPDIYLKNIIKYKKSQAKLLSEFGGKPIILDFWNTVCKSCIERLPLLDSIQKENKDQLTILLVNKFKNPDYTKRVSDFFKDNKFVRNVSLPTTTEDDEMAKFFPGEPYQVWIDNEGIIQSISEEINREDVKQFLLTGRINLKQYAGIMSPLVNSNNFSLMKIDEDYNRGNNLIQYSYFSKFDSISTYPNHQGVYLKNNKLRIIIKNQSLAGIYEALFVKNQYLGNEIFHRSQLIEEYSDTVKYRLNDIVKFENLDQNIKERLFCYEKVSLDTSYSIFYSNMKNDLDGFFNLNSSIVKRNIDCFVIRRINNSSPVLPIIENDSNKTPFQVFIRNLNADKSILFTNKNSSRYVHPLVDETGFKGEISGIPDLPPPNMWNDLKYINSILRKYNIIVFKEKRELPVILLTKNL